MPDSQKQAENEGFASNRTELTQKPKPPNKKMGFPQTITVLGETAKLYGKTAGYQLYRVAYKSGGVRKLESFANYTEAVEAAKKICRDLAKGRIVLTNERTREAVAAFEVIDAHYQETGKRLHLSAAMAEYAAIIKLLGELSAIEAVRGWLANAANVKRVDLAGAVDEFIASRDPLTEPREDGKRPQLSAHYHDLISCWLRKFAASQPGHAVCDLTKEHLDLYFKGKAKQAPKTRNLHRGAITLFLGWAKSKDYLPRDHRLLEAQSMKPEAADVGEIEFYQPGDFRKLLDNAPAEILPIIAIGGLAGIRLFETLRLTWENVFKIPGQIEVTGQKSKTRARRLVEICPALALWLEPYRGRTGPLYAFGDDTYQAAFNELCDKSKVAKIRNGLRHSFCTYHFALHGNENLTAQQAGNSPGMIHSHYKGLATKPDAKKWFAVAPATAAENVITLQAGGAK